MTTISFPDANEEGFLPLARLRRIARDEASEAFAASCPAPAVRVVAVGEGKDDPSVSPDESSPQLVTLSKSGSSAFRYFDEVAFVRKRPGNPFPQFISVGRAPNNDIVLSVDGVSKNHGYFTQKEGRWFVADSRSTNGVWINDKPVQPGLQYPIESGDRVRWGDALVTEFLDPEALYRLARAEVPG